MWVLIFPILGYFWTIGFIIQTSYDIFGWRGSFFSIVIAIIMTFLLILRILRDIKISSGNKLKKELTEDYFPHMKKKKNKEPYK